MVTVSVPFGATAIVPPPGRVVGETLVPTRLLSASAGAVSGEIVETLLRGTAVFGYTPSVGVRFAPTSTLISAELDASSVSVTCRRTG